MEFLTFDALILSLFVYPKDMGHLPESKIQKFLHEPTNLGRAIQAGDNPTIPPSAEAIPTSHARPNPYG